MKRKKMKLFRLLLKDFTIYGITAHKHCNPFIKRTILAFFVFSCAIILNGAYFLFEAETFQEYANSALFATALIAATVIFTCTVWSKRQLFKCLNELEQIIDGSEFDVF